MSDFFADRAAERDQLARQLDPEGEADARREAEAAKAALEAYHNGRQRLSGTSTPEEQELSDRAVETRQRCTAIEAANKRARSRIAELDVPLEAPRRMEEATQDLRTKNAALQAAQSNLRDVDRVIADLCSEIAKLEEQDGAQLKTHAATEFAARLANKTAKTPPGIGDLETKLRAMRATLELAQEERAEVAAQVQRCSDEAVVADRRFKQAQRGMVERRAWKQRQEWFEMHALLTAVSSPLASIFANLPAPDLLDAAHDTLRKEAEAALAPQK